MELKQLALVILYWWQGIWNYFVPRRLRYKNIDDDVVLITGGGSGLGQTLAIKLAKLVKHIVLWDIDDAGLQLTARAIKACGGNCTTYVVDVSDRNAVYAAADHIKADVGTVSMVFNNAGVVAGKKLLELPDEKIVKTFEINTLAHYWLGKAFLPDMMTNNKGHIIAISSVASFIGASHLSDYVGSKFAVAGFHESIYIEVKDAGYNGIHFTLVCPFHMNSKMFAGAKSDLVPTLSIDYVADQIMDAVRTNQEFLYLPKWFYFVHALKTMLPARSLYALNTALGARGFMKEFVGRSQQG